MALREVIEINQDLCDGCGDCVTACAEGAIAVVNGKARLISDSYCDGLGACLGHCPRGALKVIEREADAFDDRAVEDHLTRIRSGKDRAVPLPTLSVMSPQQMVGGAGCPGSAARTLQPATPSRDPGCERPSSQLRHWPVQLHLVPPAAPFFRNQDVLLVADCVAYAVGDFHQRFLNGSSLAIACPKLDSNQEVYLQKLVMMIDDAEIRSLTVMVMEVPCCGGLVRLAGEALRRAKRRLAVECLVIGTQGQVLGEHRVAG